MSCSDLHAIKHYRRNPTVQLSKGDGPSKGKGAETSNLSKIQCQSNTSNVQPSEISSLTCRHREASCGSWKTSRKLGRPMQSEQRLRKGGIQTLYIIWHRNFEVLELHQSSKNFHLVYTMGSGHTLFPTSGFVPLGFPREVLMSRNSMGRT